MSPWIWPFILTLCILSGLSADVTFGEQTPNEILMTAKKLTCSFNNGVATRWTREGTITEKGEFDEEIYTFDSIDHKIEQAHSVYWGRTVPMIRSRWEITFFMVDEKGKLIPNNIITVFDNYHAGTTNFFAVLSRHGTLRLFGGNKSAQLYGSCKAN